MVTDTGTRDLRGIIDGLSAEELRALLSALEGRVVDVGAVRDTLETLRSATGTPSRPSAPTNPATPAAALAKRPRHEAAAELEAKDEGVRSGGSSSEVAGATGDAKTGVAGVSARRQSWRDRQQQKKQEQQKLKEQQEQLRKQSGGDAGGTKGKEKKRGAEREFDHSRWRRRTVAVQLMYEGQGYAGFCSQSDGNEDTIEKRLFHALTTTKLVEYIATGENYSRCGRTDRGVSALGNLVTVSVRSNFPKDVDAELPTSPLGSLWIPKKDSKSENMTGSTTITKEPDKNNGGACADSADSTANSKGLEGRPEGVVHDIGKAEDVGGKAETVYSGRGCGEQRTVGGEDPAAVDIDVSQDFEGGDKHRDGREGEADGNAWTGSSRGSTQRSKKKETFPEMTAAEAGKPGTRVTEIDFCGMLNRVLPPDIRALAWAPVTEGFSARFSCSDRTYRYFFLARDLDIKAMDAAASRIVGQHDFRNLCKIDVANVSNFVRQIKHASVKPVPSPSADYAGTEYYRICVFEVCGQAFLWHMVRCLMSVLFMVGRGHESPEIMSFLLDLERCPAKPHYDMAPDRPLLLHSCRFRSLRFRYTPENLYCLQGHLENLWEEAAIKAARLLNNLDYLSETRVIVKDLNEFMALKRSIKGANLEHHSVKDHGKEGRRRERELQQQQQQDTRAQNNGGFSEQSADDSEGRKGTDSATRVAKGEGGESGVAAGSAGGNAERGDEGLTWREALARMRRVGLGPGQVLGRKGHMPMVRRKQGLNYDELVQGLGEKKRERLDRHLKMKTAGQISGETDAFYDAMQLQGALEEASDTRTNTLSDNAAVVPGKPPAHLASPSY